MDSSARMSFYAAEMRRGNLQILCHTCNSIKANISAEVYRAALARMYLSDTRHTGGGTQANGNLCSVRDRQEVFRNAVKFVTDQVLTYEPF
jgi:hypothetical protein